MNNNIKMVKRHICGGDKAFCESCNKEVEITKGKFIELEMPYCNNCGKIIFDLNQNYCCWCGERLTELVVFDEEC